MKLFRTSSLLFALLTSLPAWTGEAFAQIDLPQGWEQLQAEEFANEMRKFQEAGTFDLLSPENQAATKHRAKELFEPIDIGNTELGYHTLEMLHWVPRYDYPAAIIERTRLAVLARQDDWTDKPFEEIRAKVVWMMRLRIPESIQIAEARRWVTAGGTLEEIPQSDLQYEIVRQAFTDAQAMTGSFNVEWQGQITPAASGSYTFSVSPIDISAASVKQPVKFSMSVSINGNLVVDAKPRDSSSREAWSDDSWVFSSFPVELTANQAVALEVIVTAEVAETLPYEALHAILYWEGPGLSKQVVPPAVLSRTGGGAGLSATYSWNQNGQPQTLTRTDANIDFAWTDTSVLVSQNTSVGTQAAQAMWETMTAPEFIASYEQGANVGKVHPFISGARYVAPGLSSARRKAFLDIVVQNPTLLDAVNVMQAASFYKCYRIGNPDEALDVFGLWASRHADLVSEFSDDMAFDRDTRSSVADLAICMTQQYPPHAPKLKDEFLELPNGSCSLPVAYILGCSFLGEQKIDNWKAILDGQLAEDSVAGDVRVNWLLARSYATELVPSSAEHYPFYYPIPAYSPLEGRAALDEAFLVAESPATKLRVVKEIAHRRAWEHQYDQALDLVKPLSNSLPESEAEAVASLKNELERRGAEQAKRQVDAAAASSELYLKTLQERRDKATARGDGAAADRYQSLIDAAKQKE